MTYGRMKMLLVIITALMTSTSTGLFAATDGYYQVDQTTTTVWDGTDANRQIGESLDYAFTYGDESSRTYNLPWAFNFYGQPFTQITVDTNGNVWFGSVGAINSFNLANNGSGPVIAAWNNDLSSYYYGGVFIQHKTAPERVVIEWQTETYTNEGLYKPNNFKVVLFQDGSINLDYKSFTTSDTNKDFGSGVSLNDGIHIINVPAPFGLAGQSFAVTPTGSLKALNVSIAGGGTGKVSSNLGVSWTASNATHFPTGTQVTLQATADACYTFNGWSGPCTGTGSCTFPLNQDTVATAQISPHLAARIVGKSEYATLQAAYNAASNGDVIQAKAQVFTENFAPNRAINVTVDGGYSCDFSSNQNKSTIKGAPQTTAGTLTLGNFIISN